MPWQAECLSLSATRGRLVNGTVIQYTPTVRCLSFLCVHCSIEELRQLVERQVPHWLSHSGLLRQQQRPTHKY